MQLSIISYGLSLTEEKADIENRWLVNSEVQRSDAGIHL